MALEDDTAPEPPYRLGILLVHGIGSHKQGETLNDFAAPIIKWIDRWLVKDIDVIPTVGKLAHHVPMKDLDGFAAFSKGTLRPPDLPLDTPAHAEAKIHVEREGARPTEQSWLFAESWWSPQTLTPRVSPFLLWLITRGPWLMLMHLSQRFGVDPAELSKDVDGKSSNGDPGLRMLKGFFVTLVWLAISFALIVLWCVVSLIALVPIGYVRKQVYRVLVTITGVVGDSYVLINDPIQRVAFANSARKALLWLRAKGCTKIAVIAHSQGAAVARDVLLQAHAPRVDLLVTLGPGIAKLDALADREREDPQVFNWAGAAAPLTFLVIGSLIRFELDGESGIGLWGLPGAALLLAWIAISRTWGGVMTGRRRLKSETEMVRMPLWQRGMRWKDFYSSHDPVSNGSLSKTVGHGVRRLVSRRVRILASSLSDHTSYWTSRADFLPRVVAALDACAGTGLFATSRGMRRIREARFVHSVWVRVLWALRWFGQLSLLIPWFHFKRVLALAEELHDFLDRLPVSSVSSAVEGADKTVGWIGTQLLGHPVQGDGVTAVVLLAAIAVLTLHVWTRIVTYWWQQVSTLQMTPVFMPSNNHPLGRFGRWMLMGVVVALGLLPAAASVGWTFYPEATSWESIRKAITIFVTLSFTALYGLGLWAYVALTREVWQKFRVARQANVTALQAMKSVAEPIGGVVTGGVLAWVVGYWLAQNRYSGALIVPALAIGALGAAWVLARGYLPAAIRKKRP